MAETSFLLLPPESVEGIGATHAAALHEAGITTVAELFAAGPRQIHARCPTAGAQEVGEWFCKAMLVR